MRKNGKKAYLTVIIPTLNEESRLPNLLNDLTLQTYKDFEVVVVDAKSKDKTREIAQKFDANVVISNKKNVSYQRNLGLKNGNSEWLVFMDADNRISKTFLEKVIKQIEATHPDILSTWIKPDSRLKKDKFTATLMNIFMDINKKSKRPYVLESMLFIKRESFKALKGFNTTIPWSEGNDLLERACEKGMKFKFIKNPKYTYSFRRFKKTGTFKMFQEVSQMEIIKMLNGSLTKKNAASLYPMMGGSFYKTKQKPKTALQEFIPILFQSKTINKKSLSSLKQGLNTWKSFFG